MDSSKIAFISCVNNEEEYANCKKYISMLTVPDKFKIEVIPVYDAVSIGQGYNQAMAQSDAKYKVYLHQDTWIIHPFFIQNLLTAFADPSIGLLGMIGARCMPQSGAWWDSVYTCGRIIHTIDSYVEVNENKPEGLRHWRDMVAVDGLLIATQYDLPWREDRFSWHFYDASQCFEFRKAGYRVCVPEQEAPWCFHHCGKTSMKGYEEAREAFLNEYGTLMEKQRIEFYNAFKKLQKWSRPEYLPDHRPDAVFSRAYLEYFLIRLIRSIFRRLDPSAKGWQIRHPRRNKS